MMDKILMGVLFLSGWLIFSTCVFHEYHYVPVSKTWSDAQTYCRQTYTDLATIENTTEMNQLISILSFFGYSSQVWIGVYFNIDGAWAQSLPANYWNWENQTENEPFLVYYLCGIVYNSSASYKSCLLEHPFICDDNKQQQIFVNESLDWFRAWRYCTENFTELTTQWSSKNTSRLIPNGMKAWFGYIGHPKIYWSDSSSSSFRYWDNFTKLNGVGNQMCGVADLQRSGKWKLLPCGTKLPFVCHNTSQLPIQQNSITVFKLTMSSPVDLNDSAVKADILTKLQDRLQENGINPVTLKWKEQPNRKMFNKEDLSQC